MSGVLSYFAYKAQIAQDEVVRMANGERDEALCMAEQAEYDRDAALKGMKEIAARHTAAINENEVLSIDLQNSTLSEKQWKALYNSTYNEFMRARQEVESTTANELKLVDKYEAMIAKKDEEQKKDLRQAKQKANYNESQHAKVHNQYFMELGRTKLLNAEVLTKGNEIKDFRKSNSRLLKFIKESRETPTTTKSENEAKQHLIAEHSRAIIAIKTSHEEEKQSLLSAHNKAMDEVRQTLQAAHKKAMDETKHKQKKRLSKGTLKLRQENQALISAAAAKKAEEEESLRRSGELMDELAIRAWEVLELKEKAIRNLAENEVLVVRIQSLEAAVTTSKLDHARALRNQQSSEAKLNVEIRDLRSKLEKATKENMTSKKELGSVKTEFENLQRIHARCPQAPTNAQASTGVGQSSSQSKDVDTDIDIDQEGGEPSVAKGGMDIDSHGGQSGGAQDGTSGDQPAEEERMDLDSPLQTLLDQSREKILKLEAINTELVTALRNNTTTDLEDQMQDTPTDEMESRIRQEIEQEYKGAHANLQSLLNEKTQELGKKDRALAQTNPSIALRKELDEQKKKVSELEYQQQLAKGSSGAGSSTQGAGGTGEEEIRKLSRELKAAKGHILKLNKAIKLKVADHSDLEQLLMKKNPDFAAERQQMLKTRDELEDARERATSLEEQLKGALGHQTMSSAEEPPKAQEQQATSTEAAAPAAIAPSAIASAPAALPPTTSPFTTTLPTATLPTAPFPTVAHAGIKRAKEDDADEGVSDETGTTCEKKRQRTVEPYSRAAAGDAMVQDGGATVVASTEGDAEVPPLNQFQHVSELRVARDGKKRAS